MESPEAPRLLPSWQARPVGDRRRRCPAEGGVDIGLVLEAAVQSSGSTHDSRHKTFASAKAGRQGSW